MDGLVMPTLNPKQTRLMHQLLRVAEWHNQAEIPTPEQETELVELPFGEGEEHDDDTEP
jgi:hypothetical protein